MNQNELAIEMNDLTKYYGKNRGITNVNLQVNVGDFFGFIGPNGAGKSTTIRILLGLIHASSGNVKILGKDLTKREEILANIGYLPSENAFYPNMRVKDVLKYSADLRGKDCSQSALSLCERLQLDVNKKVNELSFGNRKKVAIVVALQHDPSLLILDEPTSGLDPLMQKVFFEILKERNASGTTIFLSSHILSEIQKNASRAAIIKEGKIIVCDSVEALSKTSTKRINIQGHIDVSKLNHIKDLQQMRDHTSFLYGGELKELLSYLSQQDIQDLTISEPDLEEIFLHYYKGGE